MAFVDHDYNNNNLINGHEFDDFFDYPSKIKRRQKKNANRNSNTQLQLVSVSPKTKNQQLAVDNYNNGYNLFLYGSAGTGKTFLAMYLAIKEMLNPNSDYDKVILIRSTVPVRDIGFLPGNAKEKTKAYETPYGDIVNELFGRADAYDLLKKKGQFLFLPTSFLRGTTFHNAIVVIDEFQNMTLQEIDTAITRLSDNCKLIISGDAVQDDLTGKRKAENSCSTALFQILSKMPSFRQTKFTIEDIVRSELVRQWIVARQTLKQ